jgi:hypothetical protein
MFLSLKREESLALGELDADEWETDNMAGEERRTGGI